MELMSIGKFAKKVDVNVVTLRRMEKSGELIPFYISAGGTRYYSVEQLSYFGKTTNQNKMVVGYCRVSTQSQKDDLEKQVNNVNTDDLIQIILFLRMDYTVRGLKRLNV